MEVSPLRVTDERMAAVLAASRTEPALRAVQECFQDLQRDYDWAMETLNKALDVEANWQTLPDRLTAPEAKVALASFRLAFPEATQQSVLELPSLEEFSAVHTAGEAIKYVGMKLQQFIAWLYGVLEKLGQWALSLSKSVFAWCRRQFDELSQMRSIEAYRASKAMRADPLVPLTDNILIAAFSLPGELADAEAVILHLQCTESAASRLEAIVIGAAIFLERLVRNLEETVDVAQDERWITTDRLLNKLNDMLTDAQNSYRNLYHRVTDPKTNNGAMERYFRTHRGITQILRTSETSFIGPFVFGQVILFHDDPLYPSGSYFTASPFIVNNRDERVRGTARYKQSDLDLIVSRYEALVSQLDGHDKKLAKQTDQFHAKYKAILSIIARLKGLKNSQGDKDEDLIRKIHAMTQLVYSIQKTVAIGVVKPVVALTQTLSQTNRLIEVVARDLLEAGMTPEERDRAKLGRRDSQGSERVGP